MNLCNSDMIINIHKRLNATPTADLSPYVGDSLESRVSANHIYNRLLWEEEDLARRKGVDDSLIAENKRNIDAFNQKRNDAIEKIDELIIADLNIIPTANAYQHTETIGAIIDRLSILSLKIKAMGIEATRFEAGVDHVQRCGQRFTILNEQRRDLAASFDSLIENIIGHKVYYKIYRQFKMYNDPTLNPALYTSKAIR